MKNKMYSGYVQPNNDGDIHTFYWFFESDTDPAHAPLILWTNGRLTDKECNK